MASIIFPGAGQHAMLLHHPDSGLTMRSLFRSLPAVIALQGVILLALYTTDTHAKILWRGDFETGDLRQWHTSPRSENIGLITHCTFDGFYASKIETQDPAAPLTKSDTLIHSGEIRQEYFLEHRLQTNTPENSETFFAFSFYVPIASGDGEYELAHAAPAADSSPVFRFTLHGSALGFHTSTAQDNFWQLPTGAEPGQWHRIALHIRWSANPQQGSVETWVDGKHQGKHFFQPLPATASPTIIRLGFAQAAEIEKKTLYIDGALQTDNLTELLERDRHSVEKRCDTAH